MNTIPSDVITAGSVGDDDAGGSDSDGDDMMDGWG